MKKKKRMISLLLTLCLALSLLTTTAFADEDQSEGRYGFEVQDIMITDANKDDVLGELDGDKKTVTFDPATATLTLDNADFASNEESGKGTIVWKDFSSISNLTIHAIGKNSFTRVLASSEEQRTLTFTGPGSITLTGAYAEIFTNYHDALDLVFDGVTFNITTEEWPCIAGNKITIKNKAKVEAATNFADAIRVLKELSITDSTVIATSTEGVAIAACKIKDEENVEPDDHGEAILIQNSNVTAESSGSNGIFSNGSVTIQQSKVISKGFRPGLFSHRDMTITDSTITATSADSYGIFANANLSITGDTELSADGGAGADGSFTITPETGSLWDVFVGSNAENVVPMEGSPFEGSAVDMSAAAGYSYFHSKPHAHNYGEWIVTEEATCSAVGEKERVCSDCNNKETAEVAIDPAATVSQSMSTTTMRR